MYKTRESYYNLLSILESKLQLVQYINLRIKFLPQVYI
uniref:Uncharacterized protein n=1 Tax=Microplitis mediator bracovirus TaxID=1836595 RepID=A0A2I6SGU9_9VIRU|nr:hypothetical protein MmBV_CCP2 [Microplitis mediator bracovirus]